MMQVHVVEILSGVKQELGIYVSLTSEKKNRGVTNTPLNCQV